MVLVNLSHIQKPGDLKEKDRRRGGRGGGGGEGAPADKPLLPSVSEVYKCRDVKCNILFLNSGEVELEGKRDSFPAVSSIHLFLDYRHQ